MQKKNFVWIGVVLVLLIIFLIVPLFVKGKLQEHLRQYVNDNVEAEVHWGAISVHWMKDFPSFTTSVENVAVVGSGIFQNDTLLMANKLVLTVDFMGALFGEKIMVNSVSIENPVLNIQENADSISNLTIFKNDVGDIDFKNIMQSNITSFNLPGYVSLTNGRISYDNDALHIHSLLSDVNVNIEKKDSAIDLSTAVKEMTYRYKGVQYLDRVNVGMKAKMVEDKNIFVFKDNQLQLNRMSLGIAGSFSLKDNGCDFDLNIRSKDSSLTSVFDLLPLSVMDKNGGVETKGSFVFTTSVKGLYKYKKSLPNIDLKMAIDNGAFHFKKQKGEVNDIALIMSVQNHNDSWDSTLVNLDKFHFAINENSIDASATIKKPFTKVDVKGSVDGSIDFGDLKNAVSIGEVDFSGKLQTKLSFAGNKEQILDDNYDGVVANGFVKMNDFTFRNKTMNHLFSVDKGNILIKPDLLELKDFTCKYGRSDLKLRGDVHNYLSYLFGDGVLRANLTQYSELLVLEDFLSKRKKKKVKSNNKNNAGDSGSDLVKVPKDLDCLIKMNCNRFKYDDLNVKDVKGDIHMQDGNLMMDGLAMNLLNGSVLLSGKYSTHDTLKPYVDLSFIANSIDLNETANSFHFVKKIIQGANNTNGKVNMNFNLKSKLTPSMNLIDESITGDGKFYANYIEIKNSKVFDDMANLLSDDKYKVLRVQNVKIDFKMGDGKLKVKPFSVRAFDKTFHIKGEQGFDKSLNYNITAPVTGTDVAAALGFPKVKASTKEYPVDVLIKGNSDDPKIDLDFSKAQKKLEKDISSSAEDIINGLLKDDKIKKSINDFFKGL